MMSLKDMSPEVLTTFLLKENLVDTAQVENFFLQDIDGETLLGMSASELMSHLGFTFGKAARLMKWLKIRIEVLASPVAISREQFHNPSGTEVETVLEQVPLAVKKPCSSTSSQRGCVGRKLSILPLDPVTDIDDLKLRVFHKKPADEYANMWGKGYLESYHPRAHAIHNKNVERMRGFFADVYNPVVAKAWDSSFKADKEAYNSTLQFIESCIPQIEPLVLVIRGVSMSIQWTANDIMRGWFLDHKKHSIRKQRLEQIRAIEIDNKAFLGSLPVDHIDVDKYNDSGEKRVRSDVDFSEALPNLDVSQLCGLDSFHSSRSSTKEGSKNPFLREGSQSSNGSVPTDHQREKSPPFSSTSQEGRKRQKKTLLVVGEENCKTQITRGAIKALFGEDHSLSGMPAGGLGVEEHVETSICADLSQRNQHSGGTDDTEIIQHDEQDIELDSVGDLKAMPSLMRKTAESSISNTSTDAHSPNPSITSNETDDSAKLKHPKKYLHDIFDDHPEESPTATRSELPKGNSTGLSQRLPFANIDSNIPPVQHAELTTDTKMSKLKSVRRSKNDSVENRFPASASVLPFNNRKFQKITSTPVQALEIDALTEDSKLTVAYKAMKLPSKKEVGPQLKSFIATQNRRVQTFNDHALYNDRKTLPFSGHANMATPALLDMLVTWALEFRVNIVNAPKPINGKTLVLSCHPRWWKKIETCPYHPQRHGPIS